MSIIAIDEADVRRLAPMPAVIWQTRVALRELARGAFDSPQRHAFGDGASVVMPLFHAETGTVVVKTLTLDPAREPLIRGAVTWASSGEHHPVVVDAEAVTAIRTGAIVGLAVDELAAADVREAVVFGVGGQSADQVRAILAVRELRLVTLVARRIERAERSAAALATEFPDVRFTATTDHRAALATADVVCCATTATEPLFAADELAEHVVVTAIGSYTPAMRELPEALLAEATAVVVDDRTACLTEAGEIIAAVSSGALDERTLVTLGELLEATVARSGRRVFKSVGLAAQDWAIMTVLGRAVAG